MIEQIPLDFTAARAAGKEAGERAAAKADKASPGFSEEARAFFLKYLEEHQVSSGELMVDAAKLAGITRQAMRKRAEAGTVRSVTIDGLLFIRREDVLKLSPDNRR